MTYEKSNFRIVKTNKGFRVDILKSKWSLFGIKKYWTHFISYSGIPDEPFYYSSFDMAMSEFDNDKVMQLAKEYKMNVIFLKERRNINNRKTEILITNYSVDQVSLDFI